MAELTLPEIIKRPQIMDYYNLALVGATPNDFSFMGTGFTQADQTFGAAASTKQYINEYAESQVINNYKPTITINADLMSNEKVMMDMFDIANRMKTGGMAIREYVRVWGFKPTGIVGEFEATRWLVTVMVDTLNSDAGSMVLAGSLAYFSGHQNGKFNVTTKAFTEVAEVAPVVSSMTAKATV